MLFHIYEYDSYDRAIGSPSTMDDLKYVFNSQTLPELIQVSTYEVRESESYHPSKEPKAIIESGEPKVIWETSAEEQKKYDKYCLVGRDHQWRGNYFSRTVDVPVYGFDIQTMDEMKQVLDLFEKICIYGTLYVICH